MKKDSRIELRVKENDRDICRFLGLSYSHVWDLGMEHLHKNMHRYVAKMYVQKAQIEANVRTLNGISEDRNHQLDELVDKYVAHRNVDNPTRYDVNWITSRIEKIDGLTVEGFLTYCKFKKEGK